MHIFNHITQANIMARTSAKQDQVIIDTDSTALTSAGQALTLQGKQATKLMLAYNITSANPDTLEMEIRGAQQTAVEAMLYIGARLLVLKTLTEHGSWHACLERLGMAPGTVQKIMQATLKFANPDHPRDKLLGVGKGKLLELLTLDDEQLDQLEAGEMMELDLDDVAQMSTTELRRKLREARADGEGKDKLLAKRGSQIDKLQQQVDGVFTPDPTSAAQTEAEQVQYLALQDAHAEVNAAAAKLAVVVRDIKEAATSEAMSLEADSAMVHTCQRIADIVAEHAIEVDFEEMVTPTWLAAATTGSATNKAKAKGK
jgi:hypothetical protein